MSFSIRSRLTVLSVAPVTILALILLLITAWEASSLSERQSSSAETSLLELKKQEVKAYIEVAYSAIEALYESGATLEEALPILRSIKYGKNGYVFGYSGSGDRIFIGQGNKGIGDNFWDLTDSNGKKLIQELVAAGKAGGGYVTYHFPKPGQTEAEPKLSYAIFLDRWDLMVGTGFYLDDVNEIVGGIRQTADDSRTGMVTTLALTSIGLLVLTVIIGGLISRSIMLPLSQISDSMADLAKGDADLTARLDASGKHELGQLAGSFNAFVSSLQDMIGQVRTLAAHVTDRSTVMTSQIVEIDGLLSEQNAQTEQAAAAMSEMSASAQEVASSATEAAGSASEADQNARSAEQIVTDSRNVVVELADDINSSNEAIKQLEGNVHEIVSVVDVIQGIAEQTNLLALNAAIEAARAGEQGRGFAVVADEVRTLATKTHSSTEEIHAMIEKLKQGSSTSVAAMQQSFDRSHEAVEKSEAASAELQKIADNINRMQQVNDVIATAANEQNQVSDDIAQRIVAISDQSVRSVDIAQQSRSAGDELARDADSLSVLVGRFRID
ncbi:methyl-accepting chemotaxis protein [Motiliproteus coralliicola]|uniref:Methyl-accepting chemotaxis protein n=1 Tax=Motiliproteus coralliicola TaxID=2283196 RepID=A0A369WXG8_9GAMM|nr:methyl-accepting chemotaxis protein [Motiliproteus coralliicola]RDE25226.1 methyl-accepting chemotaxis protein [Motiliproteus coralliicola]